jgi:ribosomal protein S18 acetylase RimI-like enzyme
MLRPATDADVEAMVELQLEAWREGFVPILPPDFEVPDPEEFAPRLAEALAVAGVNSTLALEGERLVGWITYGVNRDADAGPGTGEIRSLFVHPDRWRSGIGSELMDQALAALVEEGYSEATVWSFDDNERANEFYERHGFVRDGAGQRRDFSAGALEVRYRRSL